MKKVYRLLSKLFCHDQDNYNLRHMCKAISLFVVGLCMGCLNGKALLLGQ